MEIELADGTLLNAELGVPLGNPKHPMKQGDHACLEKFRKCVDYAAVRLDDREAARVVDMIGDLENVKDVSAIIPRSCRGEG